MKECPFCGAKIKNENEPCPGCGYGYSGSRQSGSDEIFGEAKEIDSKVIPESPGTGSGQPYGSTSQQADYMKPLGSLWKALFILIAIFFSPIAGLIIAIVLMTRPYPRYKSFGMILLALSIVFGIISLVLNALLGFVSVFMFC